jgi:hypothetical protein
MGRLGTPLPSWHPPWNSRYWRGQKNHVSVWNHTHKSSYFIINCIVIYYDLFCPWSVKKNPTGLAVASPLANIEPFKKRVSWGVFGITCNMEELTGKWSCIKRSSYFLLRWSNQERRDERTHTEEKTNSGRLLVGKPTRNKPPGRPRRKWKSLKWILKNRM